MSEKKHIEEMVEFLNNRINVERNSYFGKGCITIPLVEADKILDVLKGYRKQSEGEWLGNWDYECSVCHEYHDIKTKYCPNCGAKMTKGDVD